MTSVAKTTIAPDVAALTDGQTIDSSDVTTPIEDLRDYVRAGYVTVTDNDTHVKKLNDALTVSSELSKTVGSAGADETLALAVGTTLTSKTLVTPTIASFTNAQHNHQDAAGGGKLTVSAVNSGVASSGYVMTADGAGNASWAASGGGGAQPVDITQFAAGATLAERDAVYLDASYTWQKIDTNVTPIACGALRGIVNQSGGIASAATGSVRILGEVSGFTGLTAGALVYASTTSGSYTQTRPTVSAGGGQVALVPLGIAVSTTIVLVLNTYKVEYLKRESLANAASLTILHHSDPQGRSRRVRGYVGSTATGTSLATYASSNQDSNQALSTKTITTYNTDQCSGGTASASGVYGAGFEADKAFDNDNATRWINTTSTVAGWLEYQFAGAKTIRKYTVRAHNTTPGLSPKTWTFQYHDGSAWQTVDTQTNITGWTAGEQKTYTFSSAASATRWRINVTAVDGGTDLSIAELEMMDVATYTDGATKLSQSFQVSGTQTVDQVKLWLKKVAAPTGTMTLRIETNSGSAPSGTLADANATITVAESSLTTSYGWITFDFAVNFSLSGSTTYWLVLSTSRSIDELNYVHWGTDASSPSYASGSFSTYGGSWSAASQDGVFEVLAPGTTFDEPCVIGRSSGGTRDIGVRFDDGAGASGDTNTYFTNVSGGTLDVTCIVEV